MNSQVKSTPPTSFSVVLEAATITPETQASLISCLESLATQDLSPVMAEEVLIMDVGNIGQDVEREITDGFPWANITRLPKGTRYYEAKMAGAELATGEVVVFCDGDNTYLPGWLDAMVRPFAEKEDLTAITGQTSVKPDGIYSTAFALTFFFPPFEDAERGLTPAEYYVGNNFAFRRLFLLENAIPTGLPLLRGNEYVHSVRMRNEGYGVWHQHKARALHNPPESFAEIVHRYLARGSDRLQIARLTRDLRSTRSQNGGAWAIAKENVNDLLYRIFRIPREAPRSLLYYPFALPMSLFLLAVVALGITYSRARPGVLVENYDKHQYPHLPTGSETRGDDSARTTAT